MIPGWLQRWHWATWGLTQELTPVHWLECCGTRPLMLTAQALNYLQAQGQWSLIHALGHFGPVAAIHIQSDSGGDVIPCLETRHRQILHAAAEALEDIGCLPGCVPSAKSEEVVRARCRSAVHSATLFRRLHRAGEDPLLAMAPGGGKRKGLSACGRRPAENIHGLGASGQGCGAPRIFTAG
mmetsp:Transcript_60385/g.189831  ORF Transcript_60385/g.189831 Transcript_60385/m.189831 type:complete len:182 (+) Transcript_60385:205-750(+)